MTDLELLTCLLKQIKKHDITFYDMVGNRYIDASRNQDKSVLRYNRFNSVSWCDRLSELIAGTPITPQDLFQYWWNNLTDQQAVLDDIYEDIFVLLKDELNPCPVESEDRPVTINPNQLKIAV